MRGLWVGRSPKSDVAELRRRLEAAVEWIQRAQKVTVDGGISKGYDVLRDDWSPSYPETTGYTVPTLLNAAAVIGRPELGDLALSLATYLLDNTTPEGGAAHWARRRCEPIVFDTGQVMFGWLAAFGAGGDERYLRAAIHAGNWLASVQHPSGAWYAYQHLGVEKVIDTRVAWALLQLHRHSRIDAHRVAAIRNLEWALQRQDADGWFRDCAFTKNGDPFTHTLAYTAEGLFESGHLLREPRYIEAARRMSDALVARQRADGSLAATYGPAWRETSRSSCLTGNCQMARLWLRFHELDRRPAYYDAALKAIEFVAATQHLTTSNPNVRGAIAGSRPFYGRYERFKFPNWAAKFFIDAVLQLEQIRGVHHRTLYAG